MSMKHLTATVSHEMRNPLMSINSLASMLKSQLHDKESLEILFSLSSCAKILLNQVNDLLDMNLFDAESF